MRTIKRQYRKYPILVRHDKEENKYYGLIYTPQGYFVQSIPYRSDVESVVEVAHNTIDQILLATPGAVIDNH